MRELVGDWSEVLRELPERVGDWMERLQSEGVRGADLVFACIGPALEIFSRYPKVETAEGREVGLPEFLEKVWEVVGRGGFQRKWSTLPQYQQTRGTLAMFAQWISMAYREGCQKARREPLITLGSAPLDVPEFRGVVLSQLSEPRLLPPIDADISGAQSHARALDADTKGPLKDIHRRVATTILFESSGGQVEKLAHLPELRFALGEPEVDTTSIDNAAYALESKAFFISRVGSDGFRIYHKATIRKAVNDRRASLDEDEEIKPTMKSLVKKEFERGASLPFVAFPKDGSVIQDSPKLTLILPRCCRNNHAE